LFGWLPFHHNDFKKNDKTKKGKGKKRKQARKKERKKDNRNVLTDVVQCEFLYCFKAAHN
jgi:hypothetical protein